MKNDTLFSLAQQSLLTPYALETRHLQQVFGKMLASPDFSVLSIGQPLDTSSEAFSASMMVGRLVFADVIWGITEASTIRR